MIPGARADTLTNPFPGLRPFREDEEYLFFGRESQVDAMVNKLAATRFLAVVGTSGSGKSSLVNCGLLPALHRGLLAEAGTDWRMALLRPGNNPLQAMARTLAQDGVMFRDYEAGGLTLEEIIDTTLRMSKLGLIDIFEQAQLGGNINLLVVVDQFEELFRYQQLTASQDEYAFGAGEEAIAFVNLLLEVREQTTFPIYVVLTMRSDFLGDCAQFAGLPEAINAGQYLVPRMTRNERRAAISGPIGVGGAEIAPVLLTRLINDVGDNPDQLSILQHALNRTWARWQHQGSGKGPLDLTHYEAIGTMAHALDQHAEKAYEELASNRLKEICEKIFKALTDKVTDTRGVRRPTKLNTLCGLAGATQAEVSQVIDVFRKPSRSFLMPPAPQALENETVIDISHESLMRVWRRLKTWAQEEAQSAQTYRRLAETSALHQAGRAGLWRKTDVARALEWINEENPSADWAARIGGDFDLAMEFLEISRSESNREEREKEEARQRELIEQRRRAAEQEQIARKFRRKNWFLSGLVFLFIVAGLLSIYTLLETSALRYQRVLDFLVDKAEEESDSNGELAVLLALEAQSLAENPPIYHRIKGNFLDKNLNDMQDEANASLQTQLHNFHFTLSGHTGDITSLAFGRADQNVIATASADKTVKLWNAQTGKEISSLDGHSRKVNSVAFSPSGMLLATAGEDSTIILWDVSNVANPRKLHPPFRGHSGAVDHVVFSPDKKNLATAGEDGKVIIWTAKEGRPLDQVLEHGGEVSRIRFNATGNLLATVGKDGIARVWDIASGVELRGESQVINSVSDLSFSSSGHYLATVGGDKKLRLWQIDPTKLTFRDQAEATDELNVVDFSPNGSYVVAAGNDGAVLVRQIKTDKLKDPVGRRTSGKLKEEDSASQNRHEDQVNAITFHPTSANYFATASDDGTARVWDIDSGKVFHTYAIDSKEPVHAVLFSPDGGFLATLSRDKKVRIWNWKERYRENRIEVMSVEKYDFSQDGQRIATLSSTGVAKIWDTISGKEISLDTGPNDQIRSIMFSPDGRRFATLSRPNKAKVWDTISGKEISLNTDPNDQIRSIMFSEEGRRFAAIGSKTTKKTVKVWDTASGKEIFRDLHEPDRVSRVEFSPDGRQVAVLYRTGTVKVWDNASNTMLYSLPNQEYKITSVKFSPDSGRFATRSRKGTVKLWNTISGKEICSINDPKNPISRVTFSPDGRQIATFVRKKIDSKKSSKRWQTTVRIWDTSSGKEMLQDSNQTDHFSSVSFSPDGRKIATICNTGKVKVWDIASGQEINSISDPKNPISRVTFSPDGRQVAVLYHTGTVKVWDKAFNTTLYSLPNQEYKITSVKFSPDSGRFATRSRKGTVKLWNTISGKEICSINDPKNPVSRVRFSPDGRQIATYIRKKTDNKKNTKRWQTTVRIWDASSGEELLRDSNQTDHFSSVSFSPASRKIAALYGNGAAKVWDIASGKEVYSISDSKNPISRIMFSPDGRQFATLYSNGTVKIWDTGSGEGIHSITDRTNPPSRIRFSPGGSQIVTFSPSQRKQTATIWDIDTGKVLYSLSDRTDPITKVVISPDIRRIAALSPEGMLKVWDIETAKEMFHDPHGMDRISSVKFHPDGQRIATLSIDGAAKIWDAESGREIYSVPDMPVPITGIDFSPDDRHIVILSRYKKTRWQSTARIWDTKSDKEVLLGPGQTERILEVKFNPAGRRIATLSSAGTVSVWDAESGKEIYSRTDPTDQIKHIKLSPDGRRIATYSRAKKLTLRSIEKRLIKERVRSEAKQRVKRSFTPEECQNLPANLEACKLYIEIIEIRDRIVDDNSQSNIELAIKDFRKVLDEITAEASEPDRILRAMELDPTIALDKNASILTAKQLLKLAEQKIKLAEQKTRKSEFQAANRFLAVARNLFTEDQQTEIRQINKQRVAVFLKLAEEEAQKGNFQEGYQFIAEGKNLVPEAHTEAHARVDAQHVKILTMEVNDRLKAIRSIAKGEEAEVDKDIDENLSEIKATLNQARKLDPKIGKFSIQMGNLCWWGILLDKAEIVKDECEAAARMNNNNGGARDSRAIARALTFDPQKDDIQDVIDDFEYYVDWADGKRPPKRIEKRKKWIEAMEKGNNPFDEINREKTLKALKNE